MFGEDFSAIFFLGQQGMALRGSDHNVTIRPGRFRSGPVRGTQLPGPERRTVPAVVERTAGASAFFRGGHLDRCRPSFGRGFRGPTRVGAGPSTLLVSVLASC